LWAFFVIIAIFGGIKRSRYCNPQGCDSQNNVKMGDGFVAVDGID